MFPDEINIKILSNFDKKTLNEFSMTCKYNNELVNNNEFAIFCEKYDFLPTDNKKEIFDELKKQKIDMEEVYLGCLDFDENIQKFIFRNCKNLALAELVIEYDLYLPKCEELYLKNCYLHNLPELTKCKKLCLENSTLNNDLPELPNCKILKIIDCAFGNEFGNESENESCNIKILPKCEILYIIGFDLEKIPEIPQCKLLFIKYCEIVDVLPDIKNCEILINYGNKIDLESLEYLPNCKLFITEYNSLNSLKTEKNTIIHLINQDDHERIPNSIMNINGNYIVIHNKFNFLDEYIEECLSGYELNDDFIDNCIKEYWGYIKG